MVSRDFLDKNGTNHYLVTVSELSREYEVLRQRLRMTYMLGKGVPSREHVVAPVPEISPVGQASQGGVPVLLKELLAHRPFQWVQAQWD